MMNLKSLPKLKCLHSVMISLRKFSPTMIIYMPFLNLSVMLASAKQLLLAVSPKA